MRSTLASVSATTLVVALACAAPLSARAQTATARSIWKPEEVQDVAAFIERLAAR